jgi:hypothetical protein
MTRSHEFFKEDIEPEELDEHIWRMEMDMEMEKELRKLEPKPTKIVMFLSKNRVKNRKFDKYGNGTRISIARKFPERLPF